MARERGSRLPWLLAAGALAVAWRVWSRSQKPYYPDVAIHAGLELLSQPRRVLAIGAHPDDLEFYAGGTLKLLSQNGSAVTMAVLSRGERATRRANIGEIRTKEAEEAAVILGCDLIQFDLPDGEIRPGPELDQAVNDLWRRVQPDVVIAYDPKGHLPLGNNPDHLALGSAVLTRSRRGLPRGTRVYFYGTPQPNVLVDITEVVQEKENGLQAHRSQLYGPDWLSRGWVRRFGSLLGQRTPAMYAEAFYRLI